MRRTLYLDTSLWNRLFEHDISAASLTASLKSRGWELAISPHVMYELAKAFRAKRALSREKARPLFQYLEAFLEFPLACVKQSPDLLREEFNVVAGLLPNVDPFYQGEQRNRMTDEIRKLAAGQIDPRFDSLLESRTEQVSNHRSQADSRLTTWNSPLGGKLARLSLRDLTRRGLKECAPLCLKLHLERLFPEHLPRETRRLVRKLLARRRYRFCHALVRADLYLNWLTAQGRVIRRDALDDCYHFDNSAYCDAYATSERAQEPHAIQILSQTAIRVHDGQTPLREWLTTTAISDD